MEAFAELMSVIFFFALIICVATGIILVFISQRKSRNSKYKPKHDWKKMFLYSGVTTIAAFVIFSIVQPHTPEAKQEAAQSSRSSVKRASMKKVTTAKKSSQKASSESAKASSQKEKKVEKKARAKNERENFQDYKNDLAKFPQETHGAITKAYWNKSLGQTVVVLSDKALEANDAQLKAISHQAWKSTMSVYNADSPMPSDVNYIIDIQDSTGNEIATTGAFGGFKFEE